MTAGKVLLEFNPELNRQIKDKKLSDGLSAVLLTGNTLWVANDETISLERLSLQESTSVSGHRYGEHQQFRLDEFLQLPKPPTTDPDELEEVDIEGLDFRDGYLWLIGSHSLKRKKLEEKHKGEPIADSFARLRKVAADGNRFLLARIPVTEEQTLAKEVTENGPSRIAARLRGNKKGNDLTQALAEDVHLKSFFSIPSKDNGFDIEGLCVMGERIFIGLRGPVLRGWAIVLEISVKAVDDDPTTLELKALGPDNRLYRKHLLNLNGLGVRDMCAQFPDLFVLAGPTMDLDGPTAIYRWPGVAQTEGDSVTFNLQKVVDVPYGDGADHAEGMTIFKSESGGTSVLVVYDAVSKDPANEDSLTVDMFELPGL